VQLSVSGPLNLDLGARFGFQHKISYSIKIKTHLISYSIKIKTHLLVISNLYLDKILIFG